MEQSDFIIVGGGVYGAAFAYELVSRGSSVTLLEAGRLASRASGGPGKRGVRVNARNSHELPLAREALELWPGLAGELDADTGFEPLGGLMLVSAMPEVGEIGLARAEAHRQLQAAHGIRCSIVDRAELQELEPGVTDAELAALYCPDEGVADQGATARAFAAAAVRLGATIRESVRVTSVGDGPRAFVTLEDGSTLHAERAVVLAANYGTNALLDASGLATLPLWTMVPQVLMVEAKDGYQTRHLANHFQRTLSVKPLADGISMISGGMRGRWDAAAAKGEAVDALVRRSLDIAASVFPAFYDAKIVSADAALPETYTPDGLPYLDHVDDEKHVFVAAGWHGHGFAIAPSLAKHVAEWLTVGRRPASLAPFGLRRGSSR